MFGIRRSRGSAPKIETKRTLSIIEKYDTATGKSAPEFEIDQREIRVIGINEFTNIGVLRTKRRYECFRDGKSYCWLVLGFGCYSWGEVCLGVTKINSNK